MLGINVLVIVGSRKSSFSGTLAELAGENSPDRVRVSVFDSLDALPPFSETPASVELPGSVDALRNAAAAADAVLLVTNYYSPVSAMVHNAIDWLTTRWNGSELHDKPLAVIGNSPDCYRGVWSHRQTAQHRGTPEPRIIEPITVGSLGEAVAKLAGEVSTVDEPPDFAGDTNCPLRHHRDGDVIPANNCAGARRSDNQLLARPPQTVFIEELP
jgi:NAD(P)H-dependent FMN reductase